MSDIPPLDLTDTDDAVTVIGAVMSFLSMWSSLSLLIWALWNKMKPAPVAVGKVNTGSKGSKLRAAHKRVMIFLAMSDLLITINLVLVFKTRFVEWELMMTRSNAFVNGFQDFPWYAFVVPTRWLGAATSWVWLAVLPRLIVWELKSTTFPSLALDPITRNMCRIWPLFIVLSIVLASFMFFLPNPNFMLLRAVWEVSSAVVIWTYAGIGYWRLLRLLRDKNTEKLSRWMKIRIVAFLLTFIFSWVPYLTVELWCLDVSRCNDPAPFLIGSLSVSVQGTLNAFFFVHNEVARARRAKLRKARRDQEALRSSMRGSTAQSGFFLSTDDDSAYERLPPERVVSNVTASVPTVLVASAVEEAKTLGSLKKELPAKKKRSAPMSPRSQTLLEGLVANR